MRGARAGRAAQDWASPSSSTPCSAMADGSTSKVSRVKAAPSPVIFRSNASGGWRCRTPRAQRRVHESHKYDVHGWRRLKSDVNERCTHTRVCFKVKSMETADLTHHISRRFNEDLEKVRNQVLQMGGFVEQQLHKAITALVEGDSHLGESVATDDYKVNGMEVSIDEECSRILAIRAPAAGDLRVIVAIIKTITDLERIGDEGEKIGCLASRLATMERPADKYREVKHLGRQVAQMVHDALDAFARMDSQAALKTAQEDKMVDEEYESIQRQCITFMMEDPRTIRRALEIMWIVRALERIGDHAKNICEYVIYMVHGKDIRHSSLEDVAKQIDAAHALMRR